MRVVGEWVQQDSKWLILRLGCPAPAPHQLYSNTSRDDYAPCYATKYDFQPSVSEYIKCLDASGCIFYINQYSFHFQAFHTTKQRSYDFQLFTFNKQVTTAKISEQTGNTSEQQVTMANLTSRSRTVFPCNTCSMSFTSSRLQRSHMRGAWQ